MKPNKSKQGREVPQAQLKTEYLGSSMMRSARRLQRDYKELMESNDPPVGVSARPLATDMYIWHGNLRGPNGTGWRNGVFHFEMKVPLDYPNSPPKIKFFTTISHPNVFGQELCLDMFDINKRHVYEGWVPAYTIEAILLQLQTFLFKGHPS